MINSFWKPHNQAGNRILVLNREATILYVMPPLYLGEVERIMVEYDDDKSIETLSIKGIRIGEDWIK